METTRALRRALDIPADSEVPGLSAVLDPQRMCQAATAALTDRSVELADCRIEYLRYKPETNCVVLYAMTCRNPHTNTSTIAHFYAKAFQPDDFAAAEAKSEFSSRLTVPPFLPVFSNEDECILLYFYPNDAELDGLRLVAEPKKIQRILSEHLIDFPRSEWRISDRRLNFKIVRYKPEKRAVLRIDTRAKHRTSGARSPLCVYMRTYADDRGKQVHAIMESLHLQLHGQDGITTPAPRGYLADRRALFMDGLSGVPLTDCLSSDDRRRALQSTAIALSRLHQLGDIQAHERSAASLLAEADATGRFVGRLVPDADSIVEQLLTKLHDSSAALTASTRNGFVHGDFHPGQVLTDERVTALLDFDRSYLGDVAADVGNFGAHLQLLEQQDRIANGTGALNDFVEAYERASGFRLDTEQLRFWRAFGLLQLAVRPFRTLEPNWGAKIRATLADCLRIIS